jgi:hypothetical protein
MRTNLAPDIEPENCGRENWPMPVLELAASPCEGPGAHSFDPTQGRKIGSDPYDDPTQGRRIGSDPYDDPTRAR